MIRCRNCNKLGQIKVEHNNHRPFAVWDCDCGYYVKEEITFEEANKLLEDNLRESMEEYELMKLASAPSNNPEYLC